MDGTGFVFGITGLSFGLTGFVFAISALDSAQKASKKVDELVSRLNDAGVIESEPADD